MGLAELTHKNQLCPFYPNSIVRDVIELDIDYGGSIYTPVIWLMLQIRDYYYYFFFFWRVGLLVCHYLGPCLALSWYSVNICSVNKHMTPLFH